MTPRTRVAAGFAVLLGTALLPGLILAFLGRGELAGVTTLAALGVLVPCLTSTPRIAVLTAVALTITAAVSVPASTTPWLGALLMASVGVLVGLASRAGASGAVVVAALSTVFLVAEPTAANGDPLPAWLVGLIAGASALWGLGAGLIVRRLRPPSHHSAPHSVPLARSLVYGGVLAVVLGLGGWFVVDVRWGHTGGWFLMTFLLILQPNLQDSWRMTIDRALGTVLGVLLAVAIFWVVGGATVLIYAVGALAAVAALTLRTTTTRPYWQYVTLLTPAVVLLEGVGTSVTRTAVERLVATLLAVVVALAVQALILPVGRRMAHRQNTA